jgi:hypothetical protein
MILGTRLGIVPIMVMATVTAGAMDGMIIIIRTIMDIITDMPKIMATITLLKTHQA